MLSGMLLSREEMTFDFGGARLDPIRDREILGWMMNQFLYGEVTGIQVGQWIYDAPDLESARFLAQQAMEEFQHVDNFLRIMAMLRVEPADAHPLVRFLATGMMGDSWAEHVALEMAEGEGFVLMAFYAIIDTLDLPPAVDILQRAVRQEERHVAFGETQTVKAIAGRPALRRRLLGQTLISHWAVRRLARFMQRRLAGHPALEQMPAFLEKTIACSDVRMRRMGMLDRPLAELGAFRRAALVSEAVLGKVVGALVRLVTLPVRLVFGKRRLTDTYLADPAVRALPEAPAKAPAEEASG